MAAKVKVYTYGSHFGRGHNGQRVQGRVMVAATSQKVAAEALGVSLYEMRNYGAGTETRPEVASVALAEPGVVFWQPLDLRGDDRTRWAKGDARWPVTATPDPEPQEG